MKYKDIDENAYYARVCAKLIYAYLTAPQYSHLRSTPSAANQCIQESQKIALASGIIHCDAQLIIQSKTN